MCIISIFLCFALVPKLVPRTVDFQWYWYRILKFWYRDNTSGEETFGNIYKHEHKKQKQTERDRKRYPCRS